MTSNIDENKTEYSQIRIAQVNLLNDLNEENNQYRADMLSYKMKHEINADIVTLQEVGDRRIVEESLQKAGFSHFAFVRGGKHNDYCGIASKIPLNDQWIVDLKSIYPQSNGAIVAKINISDFLKDEKEEGCVYVASCHFAWHMSNENIRLKQASLISSIAEEKAGFWNRKENNIFVLGCDLNSEPESRTVRYLKGLDVGLSLDDTTNWMDSFEVVKEMSGNSLDSIGATTGEKSNFWVDRTAKGAGILYPEMLPERRIDYLLSLGWRYGKRGCPMSYGRFGDADGRNSFYYPMSDHWGIYSDFLV